MILWGLSVTAIISLKWEVSFAWYQDTIILKPWYAACLLIYMFLYTLLFTLHPFYFPDQYCHWQAWQWKKCHSVAIACHKTCFILWSATVAHPKDLWRAIKKFWDIITKVTPKVYLQLWQRSHWPGSGVSEECSKSKHLNGSLTVLSTPITVFRSKIPKGLGM